MSFEKPDLDQFAQIFNNSVWDGNLISKTSRDKLLKLGFVSRNDSGYNYLTNLGRAWFLAITPLIDGLLEMVGLDPAKIETESAALVKGLRAGVGATRD